MFFDLNREFSGIDQLLQDPAVKGAVFKWQSRKGTVDPAHGERKEIAETQHGNNAFVGFGALLLEIFLHHPPLGIRSAKHGFDGNAFQQLAKRLKQTPIHNIAPASEAFSITRNFLAIGSFTPANSISSDDGKLDLNGLLAHTWTAYPIPRRRLVELSFKGLANALLLDAMICAISLNYPLIPHYWNDNCLKQNDNDWDEEIGGCLCQRSGMWAKFPLS
jgi:hypothetical protein